MQLKKNKIPVLLRIIRLKYSRVIQYPDKLLRKFFRNKAYEGVLKKILLLRIDRIGDAVVTLPFIKKLKANYPDIELHVLCSERNEFVFKEENDQDKLTTWDEKLSYDYTDTTKRFIFIFELKYLLKNLIRYYFFKDRNIIHQLKSQSYDAILDLTGSKRTLMLSKFIGRYSAGAWVFPYSILYDYQLETNWVDIRDNDIILKKYEKLASESLGLTFTDEKNITAQKCSQNQNETEFDLLIFLSSNSNRCMDFTMELFLLNSLSDLKIIITDGSETSRFKKYREIFSLNTNFSFRLYNSLSAVKLDAIKCRLLLTYDGGHSHYLTRYIKGIIIFSATSPKLWKPFEGAEYEFYKSGMNDTIAEKSSGKFGHVIIYNPVWCNPCFDIGCKNQPCLKSIDIRFLKEIINLELKNG